MAEKIAEWLSLPLDPVYAVLFIDAPVRHEAPFDRVEVRGLRRPAVAAAGRVTTRGGRDMRYPICVRDGLLGAGRRSRTEWVVLNAAAVSRG